MFRHFLPALGCLLATVSCGAENAPAPPAALRVMSFNIRYSAGHDGANAWKFRRELVAATVRAFDPDLLGTQEVLADQYDDLRRIFADYTMAGVARENGVRKGEAAAILFRTARFELLAGGDFWLSETPEKIGSKTWDAAEPRICTWVRLRDRTTGRPVLFANTHFDNEGAVARFRSAKLLNERLPELADGMPVILTGDFNCSEDSDAYPALVHPAGAHRPALADSYREIHPERSKDEATFHGFKGVVAGSRIDWILHTPAFKPVSAEIVRTPGDRYPSDHFAVTAVLTAKP